MRSSQKHIACGCTVVSLLLLAAGAFSLDSSATAKVESFAPGAIPTSSLRNLSPAFAADGKSVYLTQDKGDSSAIMVSRRTGDQWSAPEIASFSGTYRDLEPAFAPSGKYLIFASSRPTSPGAPVAEGNYDSKVLPGKGGHLWKVARNKKGWGTPELLPPTINSNSSIFSPAVAGDGSLYFMRADNGGKFHLFRSQMKHGQYQAPVRLSFSQDDQIGDFDPAVAPDESYIIFSSPRYPAPPKTSDLFIVFRTAEGWGQPIDLRSCLSDEVHGIEARISPDGKTLFFTNSGTPAAAGSSSMPTTSHIWQVDIGPVLASKGNASAPPPPAKVFTDAHNRPAISELASTQKGVENAN